MNTLFCKITDILGAKAEIDTVAALLKKGEVVAIPTETVYGLAANALDKNAVKKIFVAKGRPQDNPLIVHIADISQLYSLAKDVPQSALLLAEKFWPGPLTIILPKKSCVPDEVSAGLDTVAVRMPSHPAASAIIKAAGVPLAAPSANISGFPSPTSAQHVRDDMTGRIAAVVDGGDCSVGIESTVISLAGDTPVLLRPGAVTPEMLNSVLGGIKISDAVLQPLKNGEEAASPGMKYKHYSPKAKISIVKGGFDEYAAYVELHKTEADYCLCFEGEEKSLSLPAVTFGKESDSLSQAKRLFDALRELDEAGAKRVFSRAPAPEGVGLAVCNRLYRAAGFTFLNDIVTPGKIIGITGGSGSGKSTVAAALVKYGIKLVDCDKIAAKITEKGSKTLTELAKSFGSDILLPDGSLNRRALGEKAFSSDDATALLNSITHPEILRLTLERAKEYQKDGHAVIIDAPLLFCSGLDKICDITVRVFAPEELRIERIMQRDNISFSAAKKRIERQREEAISAQKADFTINNYPPFLLEDEIKRLTAYI